MKQVNVYKHLWPNRVGSMNRGRVIDYLFAIQNGDEVPQRLAYDNENDLAEGLHRHDVVWEEIEWVVPEGVVDLRNSHPDDVARCDRNKPEFDVLDVNEKGRVFSRFQRVEAEAVF